MYFKINNNYYTYVAIGYVLMYLNTVTLDTGCQQIKSVKFKEGQVIDFY